MSRDYDVLVIGSGFGGSVAALRLSEKGYRVGVLEKGARWAPEDHPPNSEHTRKVAWRPHFGMIGPLQLTALKNVLVQTFIAVGGGSLMYGGVLYEPPQTFYDNPQWASITDWRAELAAYYDQAKRMLGVATNPRLTPADEAFKAVAEDLGVADTFQPTDVGIFFGEPGKTVPDPYFGGAGPERAGCIFCSQCMTGCPHNAKNTTERNYLYLAEKAGAQIHPMTTVIDVRESPTGGYLVETVRSGRWFSKERRIWSADQVVFAAASIGTQELLHRLRAKGSLPGISPRLGELARTNSEATLIVSSRTRTDLSQGVVGTSSIRPDEHTHAEAFHLGKGSNSGFLLATTLIDGDKHRLARWIGTNLRHPAAFLRAFDVSRAAERSITILVMQDLDNSVTTYLRRGLFGRKLASRQGVGAPNQNWIPAANDVARRTAQKLDGDARGYYFDLIGRPTTAHFIGGCPIGDSPATGVVDPYHRLYGHPGLHVIDGSTITANLGVNPALTITAMSERAVALWPNNGEPDPRPAPGAGYRPVAPVPPRHPIVPASAPASLRLTPV
ncbi:GMC family oxidoreductase [Candidatus Mycobacterium wuenschmannii]|uniref:Cholesterol oxidase n=1 Tax=Candidatus Mycobacterium wuenschmannii TaxID=3027808 RepID=A0ABY8W6V9_9MYCO|nr:GMC family oxidoreductase [Candidatus Mycobacterium wuenschmannii]WIM89529.1 GMC family oxidoreductase [Candidatus Mycobacterium wuenschmannii]